MVPSYSTDENASELVIARLNRPPLRWMSLREGDAWTFHWRSPVVGDLADESTSARYARLVSATAPTRPLAICRAALKLVTASGPHTPRPLGSSGAPEASR